MTWKEALRHLKVTQGELAEALGVRREFVGDLERSGLRLDDASEARLVALAREIAAQRLKELSRCPARRSSPPSYAAR